MRKEEVQQDPRLAGLTRRYHTWPALRDQTVAEHSWQVARLYLMIFGIPRTEVLTYIIKHDMGEIVTGDPPFPIKAQNPALKAEMDRLEDIALGKMDVQLPKLTDYEKVLFKFCDLLDCLEHAKNEVLMGNRYMVPVFNQGSALIGFLKKMELQDSTSAVEYCAKVGIDLDSWELDAISQYLSQAYKANYEHPGFSIKDNTDGQ